MFVAGDCPAVLYDAYLAATTLAIRVIKRNIERLEGFVNNQVSCPEISMDTQSNPYLKCLIPGNGKGLVNSF